MGEGERRKEEGEEGKKREKGEGQRVNREKSVREKEREGEGGKRETKLIRWYRSFPSLFV